MTADDAKRLAEIKARAEAAEAVPNWGDTRRVAALVACGEDVPFLLEQLERAVQHVSEEECARRCREVAMEYAGAMPYQPKGGAR